MASALSRGLFRSAMGAAKAGGTVGAWAAWTGFKGLAMSSLAIGGALATTAVAAGYVGFRGAEGAAKLAGRGMQWNKFDIPKTNMSVPYPTLNAGGKIGVMAGGLGYGMGAGAYDYWQANRWDLNRATSTGMVEVEREDFLGATGSLAIASYKNRSGARGSQATNPGYNMPNMAYMADDLVRPLATML